MEWNLYIEQDVFVDWPEAVDIIDAAIVKAIWQYQDPRLAPNLQRDDRGFVWIDQSYLVEQLPLLGLGLQAMKKRLRRLCEEKFLLDRRYSYQLGEAGVRRRAYYHTSEEFDTLFRWFRDLHNAASNPEEAEEQYRAKPDIASMIEVRKQRAWLHHQAHPDGRDRDETGKFSTSTQPEQGNSNPSKGTAVPHTEVPRYLTPRYDGTLDPSSRDPSSRNSSSIGRDAQSVPSPVDNSPPIDFEARKAELDRQAEYLRRLEEEEAEVAKESK